MPSYRISEDASLYFVTFSVHQWLPVFVDETACLIVTESLNYCHTNLGLRTSAFVIMPTHLHLIVFDHEMDAHRLQSTLSAFRRHTSRRLIAHCRTGLPAAFNAALSQTRRSDRKAQFWQQDRHPEAIWTRDFWHQKAAYIHDNPRRKGLVRDATAWRFSSAAHWLLDPPGPSDVILSAVPW